MYPTLLEQFIREECTPHVGRELERALHVTEPPTAVIEFNRFQLAIDRRAGTVVIQDVTDATSAGESRLTIAELVTALRKTAMAGGL
jgi:hypothetical protein